MSLKKPSQVSGSGSKFFKPEEYKNALAIIFEPTALRLAVPATDFYGNDIEEDRVDARITVFATSEQLEDGTPAEVASVTLTHKGIVNTVRDLVPDGAVAAIVRKRPTASGKGTYWGLVDLDFDTEAKVSAYYESAQEVPEFLQ